MSAHLKKDYLLARNSGVITGAEHGWFTVKTPEARMLEAQQRGVALLAEHLHSQGRAQGEIVRASQDAAREMGRVNAALEGGFGQMSSALYQSAEAMNAGFQHVDGTMRQGFDEVNAGLQHVDNTLNQGFGAVDARLHALDGTLGQGFERVDDRLQAEGELTRQHQELLARWQTVQMAQGFQSVCSDLQRIDRELVRGFTLVDAGMTRLDQRLQQVGDQLAMTMAQEHALDRQTWADLGQQIMDTLAAEGAATRAELQRVAMAVVSTLEAQGVLNRQEIGRAAQVIDERLRALDDRLSRQAEMQAREHTRVALRFFGVGETEAAEEALALARGAFMGYFPAHYLSGMIAVDLGDLDGAAKHFRRALAQAGSTDPDQAQAERTSALMMLGRLAVLCQRWEEAARLFRSALDEQPNHVQARVELSWLKLHDPETSSYDPKSRMKMLVHSARHPGLLDGLPDTLRPLGWYALALMLAEEHPEDAVDCLKRGMNFNVKYRRVHSDDAAALFAALNALNPLLIPVLYAAILEHAPELKHLVTPAT